MLKTLGSAWNHVVHVVVKEWSVSGWGNDPSDWKPIVYGVGLMTVLCIVFFFVCLSLIAQGLIHPYCFWAAKIVGVIGIVAFSIDFVVGHVFRATVSWNDPIDTWISIDTWIFYYLKITWFHKWIPVLFLGFVLLGVITWLTKITLNVCCPLPDTHRLKDD